MARPPVSLLSCVRVRTPAARVSVVTLAAFLPLAIGCTSNEYVIPHEELVRLAATPPLQRGARVRVVQSLGERRAEAIDVPAQPPPDQSSAQAASDEGDGESSSSGSSDGSADGNLRIDVSGNGSRSGRGISVRGGAPGRAGSWSPAGGPSQAWRPAAPHPAGGGGSGSGLHLGGGGGGGGGNGDAIIVVVIVVVAVAVCIGLVSSEGVRFDGFVAMAPGQPVHLRDASGHETTISVGEISDGWAAATVEAKVMDDEGSGIRRLDSAPLDRRGGAFKLDAGTMTFAVAGVPATGPAMNVQAGYFFTRHVGLLANLGLAGVGVPQGLVPRHALGLELQAFPVALGPLHLGLFGNGGMALTKALVGGTPTYVSGPSVGGGALAELDLTSRMALALRAGGELAKLDQVWTPAGVVTAGVAVY
ncbi:MAG TPA: hypothetical protein VKZ18_03080 [Polyangia bacterium]|nr:hypothetical protein [Polyangia bacterium]